MREPDNHTGWVDRFGDMWVRDDDTPGQRGTWWPLTSGPGWDEWARAGVGVASAWPEVEEYGPFTPASASETAEALQRVRQEAAR